MRSYALFGMWFIVTAVFGAQFAKLHLVPLPQPDSSLSKTVIPTTDTWALTHILSANCPCSALIAEHLLARGALASTTEEVWILGSESQLSRELAARGFRVSNVDPDRLAAQSGIQGGPWLLIHSPSGKLVYSGGYAPRRLHVASEARDIELLGQSKEGKACDPWPSFGCAASRALQQKLDPLGLKY